MGSFTFELEWTITDEPRPASLENTPLLHPFFIVLNASWIADPAAPPAIALGPKANLNIEENTAGKVVICMQITIRQPAI